MSFSYYKGYAYVQKQAFDGRRVVLSFLGPAVLSEIFLYL